MTDKAELPNFKIPHAEKIEWMIQTSGWAIEPVAARTDIDPPMPGYSYTIGVPEAFHFPEIAVFGLTPVAIKGLLDLVIEQLSAGINVSIDVPLVGLLDDDLPCVFSTIDINIWADLFETGVKWHQGKAWEIVQFMWPDRQGRLPYESDFDQQIRSAQPVIGAVPLM